MAVWRDNWLWAAILVAPPFWLLLSLFIPVVEDFGLPLSEPLFFLQVVFLYPLLEEIVFRGGLQGYLSKRFAGKKLGPLSLANVFTSLAFSASHLVFRSAATGLLVFLPSLIFGHFKDRYGTLLIPIGLHCYYNAGFYLLFY